jgi:hypothetical protein
VIDDAVFVRIKHEAAKRKSAIPSVIEAALRETLHRKPARKRPKPLPAFHGGEELLNISDRNALYDAMEGGSVHR